MKVTLFISLFLVISSISKAATYRHFAQCHTIFENRYTGPSNLTANFYEELDENGIFTGNGYQSNQNSIADSRNRLEISYKPNGVRSISAFAALDPDTLFLKFEIPETRMSDVEMRTGSGMIWGTFQCTLLTDCSTFLVRSGNPYTKH